MPLLNLKLVFVSVKKQRFVFSMTMEKDYSDNSESRILAKNIEEDLESHFCDMNKFPLCSVRVIGFTSASIIANVTSNIQLCSYETPA